MGLQYYWKVLDFCLKRLLFCTSFMACFYKLCYCDYDKRFITLMMKIKMLSKLNKQGVDEFWKSEDFLMIFGKIEMNISIFHNIHSTLIDLKLYLGTEISWRIFSKKIYSSSFSKTWKSFFNEILMPLSFVASDYSRAVSSECLSNYQSALNLEFRTVHLS